jgi:putative transposase
MPRGKRYIVPGYTYHVTHRCHNRAFLLKFRKHRTLYRELLRQRLDEFDLSLFSYCITSNHVHLLLRPDPSGGLGTLSRFMQSLEGDFAQEFNRQKKRKNAFWGDRYHATMIDSGDYLWKCLLYIDLNMVRAGVVGHPREWEWTAYNELMGTRKRYRLVDMAELLTQLGAGTEKSFRENYETCLTDAIARRAIERDAKWTESLAVGSATFVSEVGHSIRNRMAVETLEDERNRSMWIVRESNNRLPLESLLRPGNEG